MHNYMGMSFCFLLKKSIRSESEQSFSYFPIDAFPLSTGLARRAHHPAGTFVGLLGEVGTGTGVLPEARWTTAAAQEETGTQRPNCSSQFARRCLLVPIRGVPDVQYLSGSDCVQAISTPSMWSATGGDAEAGLCRSVEQESSFRTGKNALLGNDKHHFDLFLQDFWIPVTEFGVENNEVAPVGRSMLERFKAVPTLQVKEGKEMFVVGVWGHSGFVLHNTLKAPRSD